MVFVASYATHPEAKADCRQRGGELVTLQSTTERDALRNELGAFVAPLSIDASAWIGLQGVDGQPTTDTSSYKWISTRETPAAGVSWWGPGQPSGDGTCVEQARAPNSWNNEDCGKRQFYACQLGERQLLENIDSSTM